MACCLLLSQMTNSKHSLEQTNKQTKQKKQTKKDVKQELLKSIKESDDEYDPNLNEMGENVRISNYAKTVIKWYEDFIKAQKMKIISLAAKQGQKLNTFENSEQLYGTADLSKSAIYFESMRTCLSPNTRFRKSPHYHPTTLKTMSKLKRLFVKRIQMYSGLKIVMLYINTINSYYQLFPVAKFFLPVVKVFFSHYEIFFCAEKLFLTLWKFFSRR